MKRHGPDGAEGKHSHHGRDQGFMEVTGMVLVTHIPVIIIEAIIKLLVFLFLKKVNPNMMEGNYV